MGYFRESLPARAGTEMAVLLGVGGRRGGDRLSGASGCRHPCYVQHEPWPLAFGSVMATPNEITTLDAAMTLLFHVVGHSRGASEFHRLPVNEDKEMHRQTLRMSLALDRNGAVFRRPTRPGRRTKVRSPAPPSGSAHDGLPMVAPFTGKPGGWSPDARALSNRMSASPEAHPQR